jgi:hypothetical protein
MRSNKDILFRVVAGILGVAVLACAAYTLAYFNRGKDWRDYTPAEKIAAFTPTRVQWGPPPTLMHPPSKIVIVEVSGPTGSFCLMWKDAEDPRPRLVRVGLDSMQMELVRGSDVAKAIDDCLARGIRSTHLDYRAREGIEKLVNRLAVDAGKAS